MKYKNKSTRTGTERPASISNLIERMGGSGSGGGKIGFKYKPSAKGAKNISGDTQTAGKVAQSPSEGVLSPSRKISYLLDKGFNKILGLFATAGATKALNKRKKEKKNKQGTILTSN
mgnify:CR=1 FL=1